jgi:choline-glycine betaine transporter
VYDGLVQFNEALKNKTMAARKIKSNNLIIYIIAIIAIVVLVIWLGNNRSLNGMMHGNHGLVVSSLNWVHIIVSLAIGFVLGVLFSRRR